MNDIATTDSLKSTANRTPSILEPEFLRPADVFEKFRVKRGHLYRLIESGKVRSIVLRERGKARGVRLVVHQSIRDYILSHEVTPDGKPVA